MSCKVKYCRFSSFHTTKSHQCGCCGEFGHGQMECGNISKIDTLKQYFHEELSEDKWCEFDYCEHRKYHTTSSHYCKFCSMSHRNINECVYKDLEETNNILGINLEILPTFSNNDNFYMNYSFGLENMYYIRKKEGVILSLFMNQDMWGQYGDSPRFNYRPLYDTFVEGLVSFGTFNYSSYESNNHPITGDHPITNSINKIIKCPLCRTENNMKDIITIKGLSETCKVCLVNEIEKCFPACNHACVCEQCLELL